MTTTSNTFPKLYGRTASAALRKAGLQVTSVTSTGRGVVVNPEGADTDAVIAALEARGFVNVRTMGERAPVIVADSPEA